MAIGERLREQRQRVGLSLGQVGEYEEVTPQYLSDLERGRNNPPAWPLLARLAKRYHCTTDYLLGLAEFPDGYAPAKPLPSHADELIEVLEELSEDRRVQLVAHAQVLAEAELRERNQRQAAAYLDQAEALGPEYLDALLKALDLLSTEGRPAAEAFITRFWAEQAEKRTQEEVHQA